MRLPKTITAERIIIREFIKEDFNAFQEFMTNENSTKYLLFEDEQKTEQGSKDLFEYTLNSYSEDMVMASLAIADRTTNQYIGSVGFAPDFYEGNIQVYWSVNEEFQNNGYATEAMSALLIILKPQHPAKIRAYCHSNNHASARIALKLKMNDLGTQFIELISQNSRVFEI